MKRLWLALFLIFCPFTAKASFDIATAPISRTNLPWWNQRWHETLAARDAHKNAQLIWLGDSITYYWFRHGTHGYDDIRPVWNKYYAPYNALNFGFIGDTTASLIWRLDHGQVEGLHPRLVIILIGANNFGHPHWDAAMTIPAIEDVVANTHKRLPQAHIILLGVLPCLRGAWIAEQTHMTNAALAKYYTGSPTVTFLNLGHLLTKDGKVQASLFVDPHFNPPEPALHPDREGMTRIAEALAPYVATYARHAPAQSSTTN